jgi:hypothetical protein
MSVSFDGRSAKLAVVPDCLGAIMPFYVCMAGVKPPPSSRQNQVRSVRQQQNVERMGELGDDEEFEDFGTSSRPAWRDLLREVVLVAGSRQLIQSSPVFFSRFGSALSNVCRAHGLFRTVNQLSGLVLGRTAAERRRRRRQSLAFANRILNVAGVEITSRDRPGGGGGSNKKVVNLGQVLIDGQTLDRK